MRQIYLVLVAFLQLLLASCFGPSLAQDLNIQGRLNDMMPPPQVQTPNFNAGRTNQANTVRTARSSRKAHYKQHKYQ